MVTVELLIAEGTPGQPRRGKYLVKSKSLTTRARKKWKSFKKTDFYKSCAKVGRPIRNAALRGALKAVSKSGYWLVVAVIALILWQFAPWVAVVYAAAMGLPGLQ